MRHLSIFLATLLLLTAHSVNGQTPEPPTPIDPIPHLIQPDWNSINGRGYPQWFTDAKLGIFIHWGVYSVPAFASNEGYAEWYYRGLSTDDGERKAYQEKMYGPDFRYEDYAPLFRAELWDPEEWADLFEKSGARYVLLVSKHHDGYCMWPSDYAPGWNTAEVGPHRDVCGELSWAVRQHNMKMGFYYSLPEWTNPLHRWYEDPDDSIATYVNTHMIPQFQELVDKYEPSIIFTDGEWRNSAEQWHALELIAWYYNAVGEDAIVNDRWGSGGEHGFRTPEYSAGITQNDRPWAECRGLGRSFGLNRNEPLSNYLTSDELIRHFVTLVAAGGGMTLNVGPAADGKIPLLQQERLLDLGNWLKINGEAIYGSYLYKKSFEMKPVTVERVDASIDFDWRRNAPDASLSCDDFQAHWIGVLNVQEDSQYTFEAEVDDNMTLIIDGATLFDYNPNKAAEFQSDAQEAKSYLSAQATTRLKKGIHTIEVLYEERDVNAIARLFWSSKKMPRQIVDAFYTDESLATPGLKATYTSEQSWLCYTQGENAFYAIALEFPEDQLILEIDKPSDNAIITLLGCDKVLPWTYSDGKLFIDTSILKYSDIGKSAWTFKIAD